MQFLPVWFKKRLLKIYKFIDSAVFAAPQLYFNYKTEKLDD